MAATFQFELLADYHQFYLQDADAKGDLSESWTDEATARLLSIGEHVIGVGTVRNMTVPVVVEVHPVEPPLDLALWDHVTQCSIDVPSGKIVIAGCTDYFPDAARIDVPPGTYRARISYGALDALSDDGLDGDDNYRVQLWPGPSCPVSVLKARAV